MSIIAIVDYGMGNLRSVEKALEVSGGRTRVTSSASDIKRAGKIVFPGVGSFGAAMKELKRLRLAEPIKSAIASGKPFLGLCLGLQLLFERSEEAPGVKGLCILRGDVRRFRFTSYGLRVTGYGLKVPHMGWNRVRLSGHQGIRTSGIMKGVPDGAYMYFVHSYYVKPEDKDVILTTTDYGVDFVSGVQKDNIYAFQFHPEKSQGLGLAILRNFVRL
jgi:glutamine amidotransferase